MAKDPLRHTGLQSYVSGFHTEAPVPSLLPTEKALQTAAECLPATISVLESLGYVLSDDQRELLKSQLIDIADRYWNDFAFYQRRDDRGVGKQIKQLHSASRQMVRALGGLSSLARGRAAGTIEKFNPQEGSRALDVLADLVAKLSRDSILPQSNPKGARSKDHVNNAVISCSLLWIEITGDKFRKTLVTATGRDGQGELVSRSTRFVRAITQGIDPALTVGEVLQALKRLPAEQ